MPQVKERFNVDDQWFGYAFRKLRIPVYKGHRGKLARLTTHGLQKYGVVWAGAPGWIPPLAMVTDWSLDSKTRCDEMLACRIAIGVHEADRWWQDRSQKVSSGLLAPSPCHSPLFADNLKFVAVVLVMLHMVLIFLDIALRRASRDRCWVLQCWRPVVVTGSSKHRVYELLSFSLVCVHLGPPGAWQAALL